MTDQIVDQTRKARDRVEPVYRDRVEPVYKKRVEPTVKKRFEPVYKQRVEPTVKRVRERVQRSARVFRREAASPEKFARTILASRSSTFLLENRGRHVRLHGGDGWSPTSDPCPRRNRSLRS